jgi:hypothetical protein
MYLAENCTDRKDTCIVHGWLIYNVQRVIYIWLDIVPSTDVHVFGWILHRLQRFMYSTWCLLCSVQRYNTYTLLDTIPGIEVFVLG